MAGSRNNKAETEEKIRTAYHEAGHAVVAALQYKRTKSGRIMHAVPYKYVTIQPKTNGLDGLLRLPNKKYVIISNYLYAMRGLGRGQIPRQLRQYGKRSG